MVFSEREIFDIYYREIFRCFPTHSLLFFHIETPATATDRIFFRGNDVYEKAPNEIRIEWNRFNLTTNLNAGITISLWGYREATIRYEKNTHTHKTILFD